MLHTDEITPRDNLFALGGHSLFATQTIARIRDRIQTDIALQDFYAVRDLAELARLIDTPTDPSENAPAERV